jgi:hypothetical protein
VDSELLRIIENLPKEQQEELIKMQKRTALLKLNETCHTCSNSGIDGVKALEIAVTTSFETIQQVLNSNPS